MAEAGEDDDDKTEEPTQRRIEDAIKRGDVARSFEIGTLFVLGGLTLSMMMFAGSSSRELLFAMKPFLGNLHQIPSGEGGIRYALMFALTATVAAVALPFIFLFIAGLAGGLIQHRPLWTFEPLTPKFSRLSPMSGAKRIFGKEAFVQFAKGLAKIALIGVIIWLVINSERDRADALARMDVAALLPAAESITLKLLSSVLAVFAVIAGADFLYQRFSWMKRLRMTKQELKQEFKEQEGSPELKSRRKQIAMARLKRRMMQAVPKATVVVMNPTHFAVALQYDRGMRAPICVAKGVDSLALKIREVARDNNVPVVENPPLARALHASVDIDEEVPVEHYKAVAEVVSYVMRLKRRAS
ncbi:flagellar biosynthesis protein FlhB [Terrarubrum flagellatum]|uniref:flagellar biosynthesis protein FlhB n=1 Tax=Terrirubrum flagellatum TaxID=2895980 RepID=UPI00314508A5